MSSFAEDQTLVNFVKLSHDSSYVTVGHKGGFRVYDLHSVDNVTCTYEHDGGSVTIAELFSFFKVVVYEREPQKLYLTRKAELCGKTQHGPDHHYMYYQTILAVKAAEEKGRLVVCLEEAIYIHDVRNMDVLCTLKDLPPNPRGVMALCESHEMCYLAYPGSSVTGAVNIFDLDKLRKVHMIHAHETPLAAIAFSPTGNRLATASELGTVIRIYSVHSGQKIIDLRRGLKRTADVCCLSFSKDGRYLCCASNTETVHIFDLQQAVPAKRESSWMGMLGGALMTAASSVLPGIAKVTEVLTQDRAAMTVYLPSSECENSGKTCAITTFSLGSTALGDIFHRAVLKVGHPNRAEVCWLVSVDHSHMGSHPCERVQFVKIIDLEQMLAVVTLKGILYFFKLDSETCSVFRKHRLHGDQTEDESSLEGRSLSSLPTYSQSGATGYAGSWKH